jgi:hypothetical protein
VSQIFSFTTTPSTRSCCVAKHAPTVGLGFGMMPGSRNEEMIDDGKKRKLEFAA